MYACDEFLDCVKELFPFWDGALLTRRADTFRPLLCCVPTKLASRSVFPAYSMEVLLVCVTKDWCIVSKTILPDVPVLQSLSGLLKTRD